MYFKNFINIDIFLDYFANSLWYLYICGVHNEITISYYFQFLFYTGYKRYKKNVKKTTLIY